MSVHLLASSYLNRHHPRSVFLARHKICQIEIPEAMSDIPGRMSERISEDVQEKLLDRMSEETPERMSEDFLQSVCEVESNRTHYNLCSCSCLQRCLKQATSFSKYVTHFWAGDVNVAVLQCHGGDHST